MRSAVLITGASRGFGRCLAADFAREIESDTDLDLVRSLSPLFGSKQLCLRSLFVCMDEMTAASMGSP